MNLGNVGDPTSLVWLYCDLQQFGKTIVRRGWRNGLPQEKAAIWVFCPLLKGRYPRDRELVEKCEQCSHFKGFSRGIKGIKPSRETARNPLTTLRIENAFIKRFSKEEIEKASKESRIDEEKWMEEEKRIHRNIDEK